MVIWKNGMKFKEFYFKNKELSEECFEEQIKSRLRDYHLKSGNVWNYTEATTIEEVYNSNKIEGNTLTLSETHLVINELVTVDKPLSHAIEALNLNVAIRKFRKVDTVNHELLKAIHNGVCEHLVNSSELGVYRNCNVYISGSNHLPCNFTEVESKMEYYINKYNNSLRELRDIFELKFRIVYIHPFVDGNGRVSRLIMNALLEHEGYPRIIIDADEKSLYYKALEQYSVEGKRESWIKFCYLSLLYGMMRVVEI